MGKRITYEIHYIFYLNTCCISQIVEFDKPELLMARSDSVFAGMMAVADTSAIFSWIFYAVFQVHQVDRLVPSHQSTCLLRESITQGIINVEIDKRWLTFFLLERHLTAVDFTRSEKSDKYTHVVMATLGGFPISNAVYPAERFRRNNEANGISR